MAENVYILDAVRTPRGRGKSSGALYDVSPLKLASGLFRALKDRNDLNTELVESSIMGVVSPVGEQGADITKTASYMAGWDQSVPGIQLNCFCASGLVAVNSAAMRVASGSEQLTVAGGVESMSRVPMGSDGGSMMIDPEVMSEMKNVPQGIGADLIATIDGLSREQVDEFALRSQQNAANAWENGYFKHSVVPVIDNNGVVVLDHDEHVRADTSLEGLAGLNPSFVTLGGLGFDELALSRYPDVETIHHVHTPGNSSGIVDGSALMLLGSDAMAKQLNIRPRARIVASALTSTDPTIMLVAPAVVAQKALDKAGLTVDDIDLFEVNEAFAAVVMRFMSALNVPQEKVNVNGGAIAMGHPLGATGTIILNILLDELERRELRYGLATLCAGGGMGVATIIERI